VYQVLVAILHTGNVEFVATENNHGGDSCTVENGDILEIGHWRSFFSFLFYFYAFVFEPHLDAFSENKTRSVLLRPNTVQHNIVLECRTVH